MMRKNSKLIGLVVFGVLAVAFGAATLVWSRHDGAYKQQVSATNPDLLFHDEFDGPKLDAQKWVTCYNNYNARYDGCTNHGNWESEWYRASQVQVDDGVLMLSAKKQAMEGDNAYGNTQTYPYISGMISSGSLAKKSQPKWGATYGYYEARMLVPYGQAVWPAFWLLPTDDSWPPEIDVMETIGQRPNQMLNTFFWKDTNGKAAKDSGEYTYSESLSNNWHVYAVNWQPGMLEWYLDGKLVRRVHSKQVPSQQMHLLLNLAVGGTLPGQPDKTTPDNVQMLVDYVRVYRTKEAAVK